MILAHISDPHIGLENSPTERTYATASLLVNAVNHLSVLPLPPDALLVTGDCVDTGKVEEYERFLDIIRPLRVPVFVVPGNHDNRDNLRSALGLQGKKHMAGFVQYVVDDWPVRLIGLDSLIPGNLAGYLCSERLLWLNERLMECPKQPTILFLHHPPFHTGLEVLDDIGLRNATELHRVVGRYPAVELILAGHVHRTMVRRLNGAVAMTCPSTAHQIHLDLSRSRRLAAVMEPPACLIHLWSESTGMVTHTSVIGDYGQTIEMHNEFGWIGNR